MAMKVKSKWQKFRDACADVRAARRDVKEKSAPITVCWQRLDYDTERPNACFVKYNTVAFPWISKSHSAEDTEFVSVCPYIGSNGICITDGNDRCLMLQSRIDYEWAVEDLESVKATRRQCFRELLGLQK